MRKFGLMAVALAAGSLFWASTTPASANLLIPGGSVGPDPFGAIPGAVVASTGIQALTSSPAGFTSTYIQEVIADSSRGGQLDFVTQTTNNATSTDAVDRVTVASFAGFTTDVGTATSAGTLSGGTVAPTTITRGVAGDDVDFALAVAAGATSQVLVVETNATLFRPGTVSEINAGVATGPGFAPAVPEPASLTLLGSALVGLGWLARRRRKSL